MLPPVIVMGVSGSGKSTIGVALAKRAQVKFVDGDDLHPPENRNKMAAGIPLDDADREPWLREIGEMLADGRAQVIACSALRRHYRDQIRAIAPHTFFVHLDGSPRLISDRLENRVHAYMPTSLLASQLSTLEPLEDDENGVSISVSLPPEVVVDRALMLLELRQSWDDGSDRVDY